MPGRHFDVIIIGGRCAGASLALRLKDSGLKILLVDRATFPSLPSVPSSPIIHPGTVQLIDELGIDHRKYTTKDGRVERFLIEHENSLIAEIPTWRMGLDPNFFYGIDRLDLDQTLWEYAASLPEVTAKAGFSASKILKTETGVVHGISGKSRGDKTETYHGDLVVGADGRYSMAAQQFGAKVVEERNEFASAAFFATWENVEEYSPNHPHAISFYNTGDGVLLSVIPIDKGKFYIVVLMKSKEAVFGSKGLTPAYYEILRRVPNLWQRISNAQRVSDVIGVKPVENGYREAFGANWALVGDAVHYKDPIDGQGMYDALLEAKHLAKSIIEWKLKGDTWENAGANYQHEIIKATHPTFEKTVKSVIETLYSEKSTFLLKRKVVDALFRWLHNDPGFQKQYLQYLARAITPNEFNQKITPRIVMNGILVDIRKYATEKRQS